MQVGNASHSSIKQEEANTAQREQDRQVQRDQARQTLDNQKRIEDAAKITGVGQHLDITS